MRRALFVADLERLRATMAGDVLRAQYHLLANDPHSLSNLDQDLPNSLQHRIPIFSLPSEWLWCDTWCSAKTKQHAKVIDLCNNPKSKADKLAAAPKIIPEWTRLDKHVEGILQQAHRLEL
jgi:UDP-glucose:glycoprotein glucosyltransferase